MSAADRARAYYGAIDADDYGRLADLLADEFVHERPDRTLAGRERFVAFMRDERPRTDTEHVVDGVYEGSRGVAVCGRLCSADHEELFSFVDVFAVEDGKFVELRTYTR